MHFFWRCPKLFRYWQEVLDWLNSVYTRLTPDPVLCLLGYVNSNSMDRDQIVAILRSHFIARKLIASHGVSPNPPTLGDWIREMNNYVLFEKM